MDGRDVHVLKQGAAGPVVLMIHGASANAREFTWTLAPRLDAEMRILMADRPGHGYSERFDGAEQLGLQARQMAGLRKISGSWWSRTKRGREDEIKRRARSCAGLGRGRLLSRCRAS